MSPRLAALALAAVAVMGMSGCKKQGPADVPLGELDIAETPRLLTGPVGAGEAERQATYVLVDVANRGNETAVVSLGGALLDTTEADLGPLRVETLSIPPRGRRMFALVDAEVTGLPNAVAARVEVTRAIRPSGPAPMVITGETLHTDKGRAVLGGMVENRAEITKSAVVLGAFYDAAGTPMMRRTTVYRVDAGQRTSAQFVGPPGSVSGSIFVGDVD